MIQATINSLKGELTGMLTQKTGLTPDKASASVDIAKEDIASGLKKEASNGNISGLMGLLKGGNTTGNPIVGNIINQYAVSLITRLGLSETVSRQVAAFAIPFILSKLQGKTAGKSDGDIAGMLGGDPGGGMGDLLKKGLGGLGGGLCGLFGR
jgi:hypothetical protein